MCGGESGFFVFVGLTGEEIRVFSLKAESTIGRRIADGKRMN